MNTQIIQTHRGRPFKKITLVKGRPFTAKEIVVRSANIKHPVTLPTVLSHIKRLVETGEVAVVDKKLSKTGRGRHATRYQVVAKEATAS